LSFLPGQAGGLFREFGFTLAMSVLLSSIVALSLCPVLASRFLTKPPKNDATGPMIWLGNRLMRLYEASLRAALAMPALIVLIAVFVAATAAMMAGGIRQELTPSEDRGVVLLSITAPQGVSLAYTQSKMNEIEEAVSPLIEEGEISHTFAFSGFSADNRGFMVFTLAKWEDRSRGQQDIVRDIRAKLSDVIGVRAFVIQPNSLGIRGAGRGLAFAITGSSYEQLADAAEEIVQRLRQNPDMGQVQLEYERTQPQIFVQIDRSLAADLDIDITGLGRALQAMLDGRKVSSVFIEDKSYDVQMLSTSNPINDPGDLENIFVQTGSGLMVPMSSFVTLEERAIAPELDREGQNRSVELTAGLTPELSLGDAMTQVRAIGAEVLSDENRIVPLAEAATLDQTTSGLLVTFGFAILVVFLVLGAQFESFVSAVVVMATVPLGLACAVFALLLTGQSLNVYSQIGLVMLIGIMAKNGILIVEFANQLRDKGQSVHDAILDAATVRLRPVMMTMTSTVVGGVPLVISTGAGAEAREALGWVIVGGLGLATLSTLYLTPVAYLLLARFSAPKAREEARLEEELIAARAQS
jgi:HAE1 family hydrophobic/amphiphilic exporter-1